MPIALQRFTDTNTIKPTLAIIPEDGSLCGKAYCFEPVGFSFFRVLHSERGKPCAIERRSYATMQVSGQVNSRSQKISTYLAPSGRMRCRAKSICSADDCVTRRAYGSRCHAVELPSIKDAHLAMIFDCPGEVQDFRQHLPRWNAVKPWLQGVGPEKVGESGRNSTIFQVFTLR